MQDGRDHRARPDARNSHALTCAAMHGHVEVVRMLAEDARDRRAHLRMSQALRSSRRVDPCCRRRQQGRRPGIMIQTYIRYLDRQDLSRGHGPPRALYF
eukprot:365575-Chlamydomonas_euryale.AAC.1